MKDINKSKDSGIKKPLSSIAGSQLEAGGSLVGKEKQKPSFEKALKELEDLANKLDMGDITLEQSLKYFEKAVGLVKTCGQILDKAEQRVSILIKDDHNQITEEDFEVE